MITVRADPKDLERILRKLRGLGEEAPKAIRNAVNDTAASARKLLMRYAQKRYTVKNAGFSKHTQIKKATVSRLTATISVKGRPLTQPRFHTTAPKSGVKTEVLKGSGLRELVNKAGNKAFVQNGNKGNRLVLQRIGKGRTPLRSEHGPSVAKMIEKVYSGGQMTDEGLKEQLAGLYQENLQKQMDRVIKE